MTKPKALIIDDEKNIRLTLSKCLSYIDIEPAEAINGEEALKKLEKGNDFDLIFLDLKMAGMGGLEVLKKIKEKKSDIPVVVITAHGTVDTAVEAMKLGAADFMQKPFTPQEIQDKTREILSRKNLTVESLNSYKAYLQFAKDQISRKNYNQAVEYLKKAIGMEPSRAEPHNILGAIMEIKGELQEAQKYYKAALVYKPSYLQAQRNLIRVQDKIKDLADLNNSNHKVK